MVIHSWLPFLIFWQTCTDNNINSNNIYYISDKRSFFLKTDIYCICYDPFMRITDRYRGPRREQNMKFLWNLWFNICKILIQVFRVNAFKFTLFLVCLGCSIKHTELNELERGMTDGSAYLLGAFYFSNIISGTWPLVHYINACFARLTYSWYFLLEINRVHVTRINGTYFNIATAVKVHVLRVSYRLCSGSYTKFIVQERYFVSIPVLVIL